MYGHIVIRHSVHHILSSYSVLKYIKILRATSFNNNNNNNNNNNIIVFIRYCTIFSMFKQIKPQKILNLIC